jgi:hypothetical protein
MNRNREHEWSLIIGDFVPTVVVETAMPSQFFMMSILLE